MVRSGLRAAGTIVAAVLVAACGDDTSVNVDPTVAPFVGTWDADSMTVTSDANPSVVANILDFGSFFVVVEPSGRYTATLEVLGQSSPESGRLTVTGSTITLTPTFPPGQSPSVADYEFVADDYLILDGATEFDFNLGGTPEPAQAHIELQRQP